MKHSLFKKRAQKAGLSPGTLIHTGEKKNEKTKLTVADYNEDSFKERQIASIDEYTANEDPKTVTWIDVEGLHEVSVLGKIGERFGLHPLVMEDILNTDQRPKMEDYGNYIYIVLRLLCFDEKQNNIVAEQISLILGQNFVISFQERELKAFEPLRERIKNGKGRSRKMGADYLAYALIDVIVDNFFLALEKFNDEVEFLEEELTKNPTPNTLQKMHRLKRDMLSVRRSIWPVRDLIGSLERCGSKLVTDSISIYLRDVYDHVIYLVDAVETFRDMLSGMLDIYLSSINNRMNEVMKVLTIIATLFMPLTFIAGIYGMNFKFMPELEWRLGYPGILAVMAVIALAMFVYFRKKKWL